MKKIVNNYTISFNDIFGKYDVAHLEIGYCGYFNTLQEAIEYCQKG
jgi:hypothetical protein